MKHLNLGLSIAAGLLGGALSHYMWMPPVQAQNSAPAPREVRAQSFVLVNDQGAIDVYDNGKGARAGIDNPGIKLFDGNGREIWSAADHLHILNAHNSK